MRTLILVSAALSLLLVAVGPDVDAGSTPSDSPASVQAAGGVVVSYPRSWRAAVMHDGTVIGIAAPATGGRRPAITILLAHGSGEMRDLMDSMARGIGRGAQVRLLGERHLATSRWARYYVRGNGPTEEYVMAGIAQGGGWIATIVAIDATSDPELRARALVFQQVLAGVVMPK